MKYTLKITATAFALGLAVMSVGVASAMDKTLVTAATQENKTLSFAIENMTCALCPITVRKAMEQVSGVEEVKVDFEAKTATVIFDPARATAETIAAASTNAGYPAQVIGKN
ncbi:Periplasmic mercury(+2) binding protein [hydrothermal vent metagenome]|uniref:Periplasmic mercury(+2) binding protein n=1 Tax=hydrothermal vent metagenome TaxID=652676 RepID=A0A3B0R0W9_9ZZZZ